MTDERKNEIWATLPSDFKQEVYSLYEKEHMRFSGQCLANQLEYLFGRRNLTAQAEEKSKEPTEPKFNIGDKVRINCYSNGEVWDFVMHNRVGTIKDYYVKDGVNMYIFEEEYRDFGEHCLQPYRSYKDKSESGKITIPVGVEFEDNFYNMYRFELAKELAGAKMQRNGAIDPNEIVEDVNEIVKLLKETEHGDGRTD